MDFFQIVTIERDNEKNKQRNCTFFLSDILVSIFCGYLKKVREKIV